MHNAFSAPAWVLDVIGGDRFLIVIRLKSDCDLIGVEVRSDYSRNLTRSGRSLTRLRPIFGSIWTKSESDWIAIGIQSDSIGVQPESKSDRIAIEFRLEGLRRLPRRIQGLNYSAHRLRRYMTKVLYILNYYTIHTIELYEEHNLSFPFYIYIY